MNTYYVKVVQPEKYPMVEIQIRTCPEEGFEGFGYISAKAYLDGTVLKFKVQPNVQSRDFFTPEEAEDISDWWRLAATGAQQLQHYIKSRDDLKKKFSARFIGRYLVIDSDEDLPFCDPLVEE